MPMEDKLYSDPTELQFENQKYRLTQMAEQAMEEMNYETAANYKEEIACICHNQGKERDAYLLEHSAYELRQLHIYHIANFDVSFFRPDETPNVEIMKSALIELASSNKENESKALFSFFTDTNLQICQAQGKERDAYLLKCELQKNSNTVPLSKSETEEAYQAIKRIYYIHAASSAQDNDKNFNKAYDYLWKAIAAGWKQGYRYIADYHYYGRIDQPNLKEA